MKTQHPPARPLWRALLVGSAITAAAFSHASTPPLTTIADDLGGPIGMTLDAGGNLVVADIISHEVYRITRAGTIERIALVEGAYRPRYDASGNLFVSSRRSVAALSDGQLVRFDPAGNRTIVVGGLLAPTDFTLEPGGTILQAQVDGPMLRIDAAGGVTPVAISGVYDIAYDAAGRMYVSRFGSGTVMRYTLPSTVGTTIVSGLSGAGAVAFDAAGNLYVTAQNQGRIVQVTPAGVSSNFVTGLDSPRGLLFDAAGGLFVSSRLGGKIQRLGFDTTAPAITVPADLTVEATGPGGAAATFAVSALDDVPGIFGVELSHASGATFALGTTVVTASATDPAGNTGTGSFRVNVRDTTPPTFTSLTASQTRLWPANHKLVDITLAAAASDTVSAVTTRVVGVTSSEPDNGLGDGDTAGDVVITGPMSVQLRAERSGNGNGRTYTVTVEATDAAGNRAQRTVTVLVPRSAKG